MARQYFSINREIFDIDFTSKSKAYDLQNRISSIVNGTLHLLMDRYLDRVIPENLLYQFNTLTIEVGSVNLDRLEEELPEKFMEAFTAVLDEYILVKETGAADQGFRVLPAEHSLYELLEYYLLTGHLPWWAIRNEQFTPALVLAEMLIKQPDELKSLIMKAGQYEHVRKRLSWQFSSEQIKHVIRILEPAEAEYIFGFTEQVIEVKEHKNFVQAEEKEFEKALWYFILTYLIAERGGEFNRKSFAKSTLEQIAAGFNMEYVQLLHVFYEVINTTETSLQLQQVSLKLLLGDLAGEVYGSQQWLKYDSGKDHQPDTERYMRDMSILRQFLETGTVPFWNEGVLKSEEQLQQLLFRLATDVPDTLKAMIAQLSWNKAVAERLFQLLGVGHARKWIRLLYGSRSDMFLNMAATFSLLHKSRRAWMITEHEFETVVWRGLLSGLLLSPVNLIDEKGMVQHLIRSVSYGFSVPLQVAAQRIRTGIKSLFRVEQMQMKHLEIIQGVLQEIIEDKNIRVLTGLSPAGADGDIGEALFNSESQTLSHLLRFFLQYGSLPWWGKQYAGQAPATIFQRLYELSEHEARLVLQFAGTTSSMRRRWLASLGTASFYGTMQGMHIADEVGDGIRQMKTLLEASLNEWDIEIDTNKMETWLSEIAWDMLNTARYQNISWPDVYVRVLATLTGRYHLTTEQVVMYWKKWTSLIDIPDEKIKLIAEALQRIYPEMDIPKKKSRVTSVDIVADALLEHFMESGVMDEKTEFRFSGVEEMITKIKTIDTLQKEKLSTWLLQVLHRYLQMGQLPDSIRKSDTEGRQQFLRQLLRITFLFSPLPLIRILSQDEANAFRVLEVTSLYQLTEGSDAKDIALLLLPVKNKVKAAMRLRSVESTVIEGKRQQELFVEDILVAYQDAGFIQELTERSVAIFKILEYFLVWRRLPASVTLPEGITAELVIRHLIMYLYSRDQDVFSRLFEAGRVQKPAMATVYAILASGNTTEERKIIQYLASVMKTGQLLEESDAPDLKTEVYERITEDRYVQAEPTVEITPMPEWITALMQKEDWADEEVQSLYGQLDTQVKILQWASEEKQHAIYRKLISKYLPSVYQRFEADIFFAERWIHASFTDTLLRDRALLMFRIFNLQMAGQGVYFRGSEDYYRQLLRYLLPLFANAEQMLHHLMPGQGTMEPQTEWVQAIVKEVTEKEDVSRASEAFAKYYQERAASLITRDQSAEQQKILELMDRELKAAKAKERAREAAEANAKQMEKNVKLFIPNAGLVLLHPFFNTYFTRLGLMEKNAFVDEAARERGVLLLQYLATGRNTFDEYELILNKILCGMPVEQPVAFEIVLKEEEVALTEELFTVLKKQWEKVKNSSTESIRASFIQRDGALERIEDRWNLRVEQRGYDMLLQTLPWAFGFIKTSWMNQILTVEWI